MVALQIKCLECGKTIKYKEGMLKSSCKCENQATIKIKMGLSGRKYIGVSSKDPQKVEILIVEPKKDTVPE